MTIAGPVTGTYEPGASDVAQLMESLVVTGCERSGQAKQVSVLQHLEVGKGPAPNQSLTGGWMEKIDLQFRTDSRRRPRCRSFG